MTDTEKVLLLGKIAGHIENYRPITGTRGQIPIGTPYLDLQDHLVKIKKERIPERMNDPILYLIKYS